MTLLIIIAALMYAAISCAFGIDCLLKGNRCKLALIACVLWPLTMLYACLVVVKEFVKLIINDLV